jgi:renalase
MGTIKGQPDCVVIGAGLSGLVAAEKLILGGIRATVLEASTSIGGRMASWQSPVDAKTGFDLPAVFDHGAQYFTIRDERFEEIVRRWEKMGIVREWTQGFATSDGSFYIDGLARFCGNPNMAAVPEYLAHNLDVHLGIRVSRVEWRSTSWCITTETGQTLTTDSVILTPPVPQSLALTDAGHVELPGPQRRILERIEYEPCLAVMVLLRDPGNLPVPGGMWSVGEPIYWIADNYLKGVSAVPGTITIHAGPEFSQSHWWSPDKIVVQELTAAAGKWLDSPVLGAWVRRWQYSKPIQTYPEPCLAIRNPRPLLFAGDAFAGPRVEGAALSGLAAASLLL